MSNPKAKAKQSKGNSIPIYAAMLAPVFGMLILGILEILDARSNQTAHAALSYSIELSSEASNLAHELQKERGMSAGHVGSKGALFEEALLKQRALTDEVIASVASAILQIGRDGETTSTPRIKERTQRLETALTNLETMRERISNLEITVPELAKFYTGTINDLLSLPDDPLLNDNLDEMARQTAIYKAALMAKEFAGVERAAGAVGFGKGAFDVGGFAWYSGLQERQAYLFQRIRELGTAEEVALLDTALSSDAANALRNLRDIAKASVDTGSVEGITGPEWFASSTAYLGELRKMERVLAASIQASATAAVDQAAQKTFFFTAITSIFVLVSLVFGMRFVHSMITSLHGLKNVIERIERAEEGIVIPSLNRRDSIGTIARSLSEISSKGADSARVQEAVNNSDTPFLIVDGNAISVFENRSFKRLLERCSDVFDILTPTSHDGSRDATKLLQEIEHAQTTGKTIQKSRGEMALEISLNGYILEARRSAVLNAQGEEIGATLQLEEVTEVRNLEKEVVDLLESVEQGEFTQRVHNIDGMGFTSFAARGLNRQMDSIQNFMENLEVSLEALVQGDLTRRMDKKFEGGFERARGSVNESLGVLVNMISAVSDAAQNVQETSQPIAQGARKLAQRAEEQAASLEEVNATMEDMSSMISQSAENTSSASGLAKTAAERAAAGHEVLGQTRQAMNKIEASSARVVEIVSVIDSIAFQTNLLALNAAVEAARAGDAGKGFAVVASEVRTLAQRSSDAASEIRGLITESTVNVSEGVDLMERTQSALDQINDAITGFSDVISSITSASEEQARGAREIASTTSHLDGLTQKNAAAAVDSARGAEELQSQSDYLIQQVQLFRTHASHSAPMASHNTAEDAA